MGRWSSLLGRECTPDTPDCKRIMFCPSNLFEPYQAGSGTANERLAHSSAIHTQQHNLKTDYLWAVREGRATCVQIQARGAGYLLNQSLQIPFLRPRAPKLAALGSFSVDCLQEVYLLMANVIALIDFLGTVVRMEG